MKPKPTPPRHHTDPWAQQLRDQLRDYRPSPPQPDALWESIAEQVGHERGAQVAPPLRWWQRSVWQGGIAASLLLLIGVGLTWLLPDSSPPLSEPLSAPQQLVATLPSAPTAPDRLAPLLSPVAKELPTSAPEIPDTPEAIEAPAGDVAPIPEATEISDAPESYDHEAEHQALLSAISTLPPPRDEGSSHAHAPLNHHSEGRSSSYLSLYHINIPKGNAIATEPDPTQYFMSDAPIGVMNRSAMRASLDDLLEQYPVTIDHHPPLHIGLSFAHTLRNDFSIEIGLLYHRLGSTFHSQGTYPISGKQVIEYLGIPLQLTYDVWSSSRFVLYATGGVEGALCINRDVTYHDRLLMTPLFPEGSTTPLDRMQWSLLTGVGLRSTLTSHLSLFVKPEVSYHFHNKSEVDTFYKRHPLDLRLSFGLRLDIRK